MGLRGPQGKVVRNALIVRQARAGLKGVEIARLHGISRQAVDQIVRRETGTSTVVLNDLPTGPVRRDRGSRTVRKFWARVRVAESGCWIWTGALTLGGYGHTWEGGRYAYAHRVAYRAVKGAIPPALTLDHLCRVRACVNPDHLEPVTHRENILRSPIALAAINARKTHCKYGHELTGSNVVRYASHPSQRPCRACVNRRQRERYARRTAA